MLENEKENKSFMNWDIVGSVFQGLGTAYSSYQQAKTEEERLKWDKELQRLNTELQKQLSTLGKYPSVTQSYQMLSDDDRSRRWHNISSAWAKKRGRTPSPYESRIDRAFGVTQRGIEGVWPKAEEGLLSPQYGQRRRRGFQ